MSLALEEAKRRGASQAEVDASMNRGLSTTVRLGEVDTVEYQRDRGVGVTVYFGKRKGSASTADLSAQAVRERWRKPAPSRATPPKMPAAGLADPEELARDIPDLDLDHPWSIDARRGCRDGARMRGRGPRGRSRASRIPRAQPSARIAMCACTAIRMAFSPGYAQHQP